MFELARDDFSSLKEELRKAMPATDPRDLPERPLPFVKRYIKELGGGYSRGVNRRFGPVTLDQRIWQGLQTIYADSRIDVAMNTAEQHLWVQNSMMLVVLPDGFGTVRVHAIKPYQCVVDVRDCSDAGNPLAWKELLVDVPLSRDPQTGAVTYGYWRFTATEAWKVDDRNREVGIYNSAGTNPLGRIPAVMLHALQPDDGQPFAAINGPVLGLQRALCILESDLELMVRHTAWPLIYIKNASMAQQVEVMAVGPEKLPVLVRGGDANAPSPELAVLQRSLPVGELSNYAESRIRTYSSMLGMSGDAFIRTNTAVTASARLFGEQQRSRLRAEMTPVLVDGETAMASLVADTVALRTPLPLSAKGVTVELTFRDPLPVIDPAGEAQALTSNIANNADSAVAMVMRRDGVDRATAVKTVAQNKADNDQFSTAAKPIGAGAPPAGGAP